jgi:protein-S-isoprenylcysteine O-methyltransferase Ste14
MQQWLKLTVFILLYVPTVAIAIPALLLWCSDGRFGLGLGHAKYLGLLPVSIGIALYLFCSFILLVQGMGTAAPSTRSLVVAGPYSRVRNPMYLAAIFFFWGEAIFMDSELLICFTLMMMLIYYVGVIWLEEPALLRRFGTSYIAYCERVPRWLPLIRAPRHR